MTFKQLHIKDGYLYLLFEHKSYPSPKRALQLLKYILNIWEQKTIGQSTAKLHRNLSPWSVTPNESSPWTKSDMMNREVNKAFIDFYKVLATGINIFVDWEVIMCYQKTNCVKKLGS
ncbi:Rpn family recombination-promoting nuclease/putative transposase [Desulfosporosinus acididurans]|uniref:Rpn family recombination-promoting nuclease/putative transposase n=1 Tax=Desulfosporosinus acididurans TaxID=476652 RepID=UPI000A04BA85